MTPEEKARIARENGAKSKGPSTQAGKDRSRANSLKHGRRATTLRHLAEPHPAILCNEDAKPFFQLFHNLLRVYRPNGDVATDIVREIAIARTDITRLQFVKVSARNREIVRQAAKEPELPAELVPVECTINAALALAKSDAQLDRAINRLYARITGLERRLVFVQKHFPQPERTEPPIEQPTPNQQDTEIEDLPGYPNEPTEATYEAYEYLHPGHTWEDRHSPHQPKPPQDRK